MMLSFGGKICRTFENLCVHFQQLIIFIILLKCILQRGKTEESDDKTYLADPLKTSNYGPKHILESLKKITGAVKW